MRESKEKINILLGFDRSKNLKIVINSLFSIFVQLVNVILA